MIVYQIETDIFRPNRRRARKFVAESQVYPRMQLFGHPRTFQAFTVPSGKVLGSRGPRWQLEVLEILMNRLEQGRVGKEVWNALVWGPSHQPKISNSKRSDKVEIFVSGRCLAVSHTVTDKL